MEIFTLVKANIRKKKGSFFSIIILAAIVAAVVVTVSGVQHNYRAGMERAFETADSGDVVAFVKTSNMNEELRNKVESSDLVERVVYYDAIYSGGKKVGEYEERGSSYLMEMREGIHVYNENLEGFLEDVPKLKSGEIYLPLGLKSKLFCDVGDTMTIEFIMDIKKDFKIKGFVQEPVLGSMMIATKQMFISRDDYDTILKECRAVEAKAKQAADLIVDGTVAMIYQNPKSELSGAKFQRELNLETNVIANSMGAITKEQSRHYSLLMTDVVLNIVLVFAIFLFVIVLIVMAHSIGTEIEIDYVTLGVLKSQGFTKEKLRRIFLCQYGLAEVIGIILGCILAFPLQTVVGEACQAVIGTLPVSDMVNVTSLLWIVGIVVITFVLIHVSTSKVVDISPVRAILGGRDTVYFDHIFQLPIYKKALTTSLAFRQFTSAKKRYAGIVLIVTILTFFMVTVNLMENLLVTENMGDSMGVIIPDILVYHENPDVSVEWDEVDALVKKYSDIRDVNSSVVGYVSLNGENLFCEAYEIPKTIPGLLEGREPIYDNEILITELVAESLELERGDDVKLSVAGKEADYMISGIYQNINDTGMNFSLSGDGMERLKGETVTYYDRYYVIEDKTQLKKIEENVKEQYGDDLKIEVYTEENNPILNEFGSVVFILKVMINVFSVIFAAVAVHMVCTKTFLQERTDVGIYKAIGFTAKKLRLQFAARFFLVALIGAVFGILLSVLASTKVLGMALRSVGITKLMLTFTAESLMVPVLIISASCMVFAFFTSSKIEKVEVRELVVE